LIDVNRSVVTPNTRNLHHTAVIPSVIQNCVATESTLHV
jgi:hypothetical protein